MVCINYKDPQVLIKEAKEASELGFHGKQAINPVQIQYASIFDYYFTLLFLTWQIRDAFRPSDAAIAFATKVLVFFSFCKIYMLL